MSFRVLARAARSFLSLEMVDSVFCSAFFTIGVMSPPGIDTATPTSAWLCLTILASVHDTFASGTAFSASAIALMTMSLTDSL